MCQTATAEHYIILVYVDTLAIQVDAAKEPRGRGSGQCQENTEATGSSQQTETAFTDTIAAATAAVLFVKVLRL